MTRQSHETYLEAGLALLRTGGIEHVTIAAVCSALDVTKGSFYHHFDTVRAFHEQMLSSWADEYGRLRPSSIKDLPATERLDAQIDFALDRDHATEAAIRAWARIDPLAADVQVGLDEFRVRFCADTLERCGVQSARAQTLAEISIAILVGIQARRTPLGREAGRALVAEHRAWMHHVLAHENQNTQMGEP